jgi:cytochrome c oxidase subunit 3
MQIPHEVTARPDTGLYNAKLGIWLFLASEVMLFGGLFSAYIFLRMGAEDGYWPRGLLNVPVGAANTAVLIASSVTVVLAWAALKMRNFAQYKLWMAISILCGALFLIVKLVYEWPQKFDHFGAFIKKDALGKYEPYLGNAYLKAKTPPLPPRVEISGHLHELEIDATAADKEKLGVYLKKHDLTSAPDAHDPKLQIVKGGHLTPGVAEGLEKVPGVKIVAFEVALDPINAAPTDPESDKPHFWYKGATEKLGKIERKDVESWSSFAPKHSPYFAIYFTITGLHGLHVLAGVLVMLYFWLPIEGGANMFRRNPEHLANRVEVVGLFWHFVDLVWIFVFPIFYLL